MKAPFFKKEYLQKMAKWCIIEIVARAMYKKSDWKILHQGGITMKNRYSRVVYLSQGGDLFCSLVMKKGEAIVARESNQEFVLTKIKANERVRKGEPIQLGKPYQSFTFEDVFPWGQSAFKGTAFILEENDDTLMIRTVPTEQ